MRTHHKELLAQVLAILFIAFLLTRFLAVSQHYPFYFIWDMDYVSTLDTMLINSQTLPDHINHPAFGMYLVQALSERAGQSMGAVSAIRLPDLAAALNPLAATAELTAYLRLHTPYLELAMVLLLWAGVNLILKPGRWLSLVFLAVLGLPESLLYQAALIRTELYAMVFWSGAFFLMALALHARSTRAWRLRLLGAGLLLGLCMLTKIQAIFYLLAFAVLAVLSATLVAPRAPRPWRLPLSRRDALMMPFLGVLNLGNFLMLLIAVLFVQIPKSFATFTLNYTVNPITILFGLGALGLAAAQIVYYRAGRTDRLAFLLMNGATLVFTGFLAAFLLHFLLYDNPLTSMKYLLYDFKMIFFREFSSQQQSTYFKSLPPLFPVNSANKPAADAMSDPWGMVMFHPALFFTHLGLLLTLIAGHLNRFVAVTRRQVLLCASLTLLALALLLVGVRYFLRDFIWVEMLLTLLNIYFFMMLWRGARRLVRPLRVATASAALLVLALSTVHSLAIPRRLDMNYNLYGWDLNKYRYKVFDNHQVLIEKILERLYFLPRMWEVAESCADTQAWIRNAAAFVFQNLAVTHRQIGIVSTGYPVWTSSMSYRIDSFPEELRGAIIVDSKDLPLRERYFARREYTQTYSEYMQKIKPAPSTGEFGAPLEWLSVLKRQDLQILLFLQAEDLDRLHAEELAPAMLKSDADATTATATAPKHPPLPMKIKLRQIDGDKKESIELQALEVRNSADLHISLIRRDYFFVLRLMRH